MKIPQIKNIFPTTFSSQNNYNNENVAEKPIVNKKEIYLLTTALCIAALSAPFVARKKILQSSSNLSFRESIANFLSIDLGIKINADNLKSVMTKEEFLKEIPLLKKENFIKNNENIKKGIFLADLHSHSNFSDGKITVEELMTQAAEYGNYLKKLNGKKFIFALSDHDGIQGVKEALRLIAKNPEKYENIKFVPAAEISFPIKCDVSSPRYATAHNLTESAEMLTYCINPFTENSKNFFKTLYQKRALGKEETIQLANKIMPTADFSENEYNFLYYNNLWQQNNHWRLHDYIQIKNRVLKIAKETNQNPNNLYKNLISELIKENKYARNPYGFDCFLKDKNINTLSEMTDNNLSQALKNSIFPTLKNNEAFSKYDCNLDEIIDYAQKEDLLLGFAHPAFTVQNLNPITAIDDLKSIIKKSNGKIVCTEKYHQAYPIPNKISQEQINEANSIMDKLNLINIGGNDNHSKNFVTKIL